MTVETLLFKNINILPELFLGISLVYFVLHGTFLSVNKNFYLIQTSCIYLGILILGMASFLVFNDNLDVLEISIINNTINNDFLSLFSKITVGIISSFSLLMMYGYLNDQRINHFEYVLLILFSVLGLFLLCSSNDLLTAYLAIELQSLSFYVLASFKKNSTFSVDAGIKYFILGAFSSSLFLFGSSLIYGLTGSINFDDFNDLFFCVFPGSSLVFVNIKEYYENQDQSILLYALAEKLSTFNEKVLSESDALLLKSEIKNTNVFENSSLNFDKIITYNWIGVHTIQFFKNVQLDINTQLLTKEELDYLQNWVSFAEPAQEQILQVINLDFSPLTIKYGNMLSEKYSEVFSGWYFGIFSLLLASCVKLTDFQELELFDSSFDTNLLQFALVFLLISLFFKLAIAPFHLWSPDVYEGSPTSSTFFFAVVPKLAIFILLIRIFYYGFYGFIDSWRYFIVIIAILSIIVGSFGGLEQRKIKTLLAYSSISHMGYSLIAFNSGTLEGLQMLIGYLLIYTISGLCIWSIFILTRLKNPYVRKQNKDLTDIVSLGKTNKILAIFFAISLLSIAGFPPMIGFLVKIGLFLTAIESSMYFLALISILCSVVATFYYIRIIKIIYFEKTIVGKLYHPVTSQKGVVVVILSMLLLFLFVNPSLLFLLSYKVSLLILPSFVNPTL